MGAGAPSNTLGMRLGHLALRALNSLPDSVLYRLSGRPPISVDGQTLAAEVQVAVALLERRARTRPPARSPEEARAERRHTAALFAGPGLHVGRVRELSLPGPAGALRARHYSPLQPGRRPLLVFYHGGGFTYGDLETHDALCRMLCLDAGVHVLAIDYRLAPEHPFPAAVQDAWAAFAWAREQAAGLGADPDAIALGGDSAGGSLAAVVAQQAAHEGGLQPAAQMLIYPVTDFSTRRRSRELFGKGFLLTGEDMDWFEANYLGGGGEHVADPRASPLLAEDLGGLAPAIVVTAGFDPLRDEGEAYAAALRAAGTAVVLRRFPGFTHAFVNAAGVSAECRAALAEIGGMLRAVLETAGAHAGESARGRGPLERPVASALASETE